VVFKVVLTILKLFLAIIITWNNKHF